MDELELLVDFHVESDRQGPGSPADTHRAAELAGIDSGGLKVIDIGCGTGASSIALAQTYNAHVTAVDLFPQFLDRLESQASDLGLSDRITVVQADMADLDLANASFDVVWSEGAAYNIGFRSAVESWRRLLRPGGVMVISEITWLTSSRPREIEEHWLAAYPEIGTAASKITVLEEAGLSLRGYFVLSEAAWEDHYYRPMEARMSAFLNRHDNSRDARGLVDAERHEIHLFRSYKANYGYGMYVAERTTENTD